MNKSIEKIKEELNDYKSILILLGLGVICFTPAVVWLSVLFHHIGL